MYMLIISTIAYSIKISQEPILTSFSVQFFPNITEKDRETDKDRQTDREGEREK